MRPQSFQLAESLEQVDGTYVLHRGRRFTYFGGCDYFRLSTRPEVHAALRAGLQRHGLNVAASRITTGNHPLYAELERELTKFFGVESALVVASGYVANLALAEALEGEFAHAYIDPRAHASLKTAVRIVGAKPLRIPERRERLLIATDGMFAHDGELARLDEFAKHLSRGSLLWVDDAHGAGTLGATGKGTVEVLRVRHPRLVRTITLSKAFGVFGGAIIGPRRICERVIARSRLFAGHTPLPLPLVCAAMESLKVLRGDPRLRTRLNGNIRFVKSRLRALGFNIPENLSPIVVYAPKSERSIAAFREALIRHGIYSSWIRYPGGPNRGYFRFALSSEHTRTQLEALVDAFMRLRPTAAPKSRRRVNEAR